MDEKTREALGRMKKLLAMAYWHPTPRVMDESGDTEALAHLQAMAEENAKLKTALKELAENIHPEAAYISRVEEYTKLECQFYALQDENAALKAEVETWKDKYLSVCDKIADLKDDLLEAQGDTASNIAQADSFAKLYGEAKAEVRELRQTKWAVIQARAEKAEAELARYRRFDPLIEAAESDGEFSVVGGTSPVADKIIRAVVNLRAALKCREKAIPESNNQSGSSQSDHKPAEK